MSDINTLPCSQESEDCVIGSILMAGSPFMDEISGKVTEDHFVLRRNRIIFKACKDLHSQGIPISMITASNYLKEKGTIEEAGGYSYICKLSTDLATTAHSEYWISILEQKLLLRSSIDISAWATREAYSNPDVSAFISQLEEKILNLKKEFSSENLTQKATDNALVRNQKLIDGIKCLGIPCGLRAIDETIGGLGEGQLIYICARPRRGKTALMEQMISNILDQGKAVTIFEKDMSIDILIERMSCRNADVSFSSYIKGFSTREQKLRVRHEIEKLQRKKDLMILRSPTRLSGKDVISLVRRDKSKSGIEAVFLDHIICLDVQGDFREGLTKASMDIRRSSQESNLPHVILAQLNRAGDSGRPTPNHVKEFDQAFADCDSMIMLWSELNPVDLSPGEFLPVKFTFVKNRHGPETEEEVLFNGNLMKFIERRKI